MWRGVDVVAAAAGTVLRVRSNMADVSIKEIGRDAVRGRNCGNSLILQHAEGYETQYCHMKQGTVTLQPGDEIGKGEKVGEVGLSGFTEYPHLHFNVRQNGDLIDPFDGQPQKAACGTGGTDSLWQEKPAYKALTMLPLKFVTAKPKAKTRWMPQRDEISAEAPALILSARVFNSLKGDRWSFKIFRPDGTVFSDFGVAQTKNQQIAVYFAGKKRPAGGFQKGIWRGTLLIARDSERGRLRKFRGEITVMVTE